jgi:hypothetical protein
MKCTSRRNPKTNRCVLSSGKIGRHIVGRPKSCNTIINKQTNRCVLKSKKRNTKSKKRNTKSKKRNTKSKKRNTKSKKRNTKSENKIIPLCLPNKFEPLSEKCACNKQWLKKSKLGKGAYGAVYKACHYKDCNYAVKIQKNDRYAKAEYEAYTMLKGKGITPKLHAAWLCKNKMYLVIDRLYKCKNLGIPKVRNLLKKMEKHGWLHVDTHDENVMCTDSNRTVLIDFGWAVRKHHGPYANHPGKTYTCLKKVQTENLINFFDSSSSS